MVVSTPCHLTFMESQLSASTPPAVAVNRTPGQLFGGGLQATQLQRCEANHRQCNRPPALCRHAGFKWRQVAVLNSLLICPPAWKEITFFCCVTGTRKSSGIQLPEDAYEFGFQPTIKVHCSCRQLKLVKWQLCWMLQVVQLTQWTEQTNAFYIDNGYAPQPKSCRVHQGS